MQNIFDRSWLLTLALLVLWAAAAHAEPGFLAPSGSNNPQATLAALTIEHEAMHIKIAELEKRVDLRFTLLQQALDLARTSLDARLLSMNEIREQLNRQATTFVEVKAYEANMLMLGQKVEDLRDRIQQKSDFLATQLLERSGALSAQVAEKSETVDRRIETITNKQAKVEGGFRVTVFLLGAFFTALQIILKFAGNRKIKVNSSSKSETQA